MFNGLTLIIIAWVTIFSAPKIYRDNQVLNNFVISFFVMQLFYFETKEKIDEALLPIKEKVDDLLVKLKATAAAKKQD